MRAIFPIALLAIGLTGCGGRDPAPPTPHGTLLGIASEFQLLAPRDMYRDAPGTELTGQSVARATLVRLANYETLYPGRFDPEVAVLKGRAFELMLDLESARLAYLEAARHETELREDCTERAARLSELLEAGQLRPSGDSTEDQAALLRRQAVFLRQKAGEMGPTPQRALALAVAEQAQVLHAEFVASHRWVLASGDDRAVEYMELLVEANRASWRSLEHALRLARLHRELAEEEMRLQPPHTAGFDRTRVLHHIDESLGLLSRISQADGRPERLVASRELDTMLALRELVIARSR